MKPKTPEEVAQVLLGYSLHLTSILKKDMVAAPEDKLPEIQMAIERAVHGTLSYIAGRPPIDQIQLVVYEVLDTCFKSGKDVEDLRSAAQNFDAIFNAEADDDEDTTPENPSRRF